MANMTPTTEAAHIPEVWIDDIISAVEYSFEFTPRVNRSWKYVGYGDVYHIPRIGNFSATTKALSTAWTPVVINDNEQSLVINKHDVTGFQLEDITKVLTKTDEKAHYQKKIGYALGRSIEVNLAALIQSFTLEVGELGSEVTYDDLLDAWNLLMDGGNTMDDTTWILSAGAVTGLLRQEIVINAMYRSDGKRAIENATVGTILKAPVVMSLLTRAPATGQSESAIFKRQAIALMMAQEPKIVTEYIAKELSWVVGGHQIYGYVEVNRYGESPGNNTASDDWAVRINTIA